MMLLSLLFVVATAKVCGYLLQRLGQPQVVGEMIAGFLIGPAVLGQLFPSLQAVLFDPVGILQLQALSEFGLLLFMFVVGAKFRLPTSGRIGGLRVGIVGICSILVATGLITVLPLWWYSLAAKQLSMVTLGFLQFVPPICNFLLAAFVYAEPVSALKLVAFVFIWLALGVFTWNSVRVQRATVQRSAAAKLRAA